MPDFKLISADSHVNEPPAAWERVQKEYGERAPKVVKDPPGVPKGIWLLIDGQPPIGLSHYSKGLVVDKSGGISEVDQEKHFQTIRFNEVFRYEDLLNPKWKGLISLETEEYQWFYNVLQIMGRDKGLDFMKKFAGQNLQMRKGHTLLAQLVAAGETAIATVVYSNRVERMKGSGAPIDWVRFKGPTITAINAISIPDKAPHPNAARLFVDFALSKEGQGLLRGQRRVPARPDVFPDPPSLTKGLNLYPAKPEGMIESYNETVARFDEIFNKTR